MTPEYLPQTIDKTLSHLIEEMGEVQKCVGKIQRFGWESYNPLVDVEDRETNKEALIRELKDLKFCIIRLEKYINEQ